MKGILFIILIILLISMVIFNPSTEDFTDWEKDEIVSNTNISFGSNLIDSTVNALTKTLTSEYLAATTKRKNYTLFSIFQTTYSLGEVKESRHYLGLLKTVFIPLPN